MQFWEKKKKYLEVRIDNKAHLVLNLELSRQESLVCPGIKDIAGEKRDGVMPFLGDY